MNKSLTALLTASILTGCTTTQNLEQIKQVNTKALAVIRENPTQPNKFVSTNAPSNYYIHELPATRTDMYFVNPTNTTKINFDSTGIINSGNTLQTIAELEESMTPSLYSDGALEFTAHKKGSERPLFIIQNYAPQQDSALKINLTTQERNKDFSQLEIQLNADNTEFKNNKTTPDRIGSALLNTAIGGLVTLETGGYGAIGVAVYETADIILTPSGKPTATIARNDQPLTLDARRDATLRTLETTKDGYNLIVLPYNTTNGQYTALAYMDSNLNIKTPYMSTNKANTLVIPFENDNNVMRKAIIGAIGAASRYNLGGRNTRTITIPNNNGGGRTGNPGAN